MGNQVTIRKLTVLEQENHVVNIDIFRDREGLFDPLSLTRVLYLILAGIFTIFIQVFHMFIHFQLIGLFPVYF